MSRTVSANLSIPARSVLSPAKPAVLAVLACAFALSGCEKPEPISQYTIPTAMPAQLMPGKDRMLAVMFPRGDDAWFVKVMGPEKAIDQIDDQFRDFVQKLPFKETGPDLSELPAGWNRGGSKPMRVATILVETDIKQLDISVSKLSKQPDWDQFIASNINRWRGQLGMKPSEKKWAGAEAIEIDAADGDSVWLDIVGTPGSGSSMSPPFANMAAQAPRPAPKSDLKFDRPEGWRDGRQSSMRLAAFNAGPDDAQAELTVIKLGGGLRDNVARWVGQVQGSDPSEEMVDQVMADADKIDVGGRSAQRFVLEGKESDDSLMIDGTIVPLDEGVSMFIKMTGPRSTVTAQYDAISSFLESLKF